MTDDLLDEATRLADTGEREGMVVAPTRVLRALVVRAQAAEADAISLRSIVTNEMQMREDAERRAAAMKNPLDVAVEKLEALRDLCDAADKAGSAFPSVLHGGAVQPNQVFVSDVRAILWEDS